MERYKITLSANAGIVLQIKGVRIWVDAIHDVKHPLYDSVSQELWEKMKKHSAFMNPTAICFTHCHEDHYSRRMAIKAKQEWPEAELILPLKEFENQIFLCENEMKISYNDVKISFFKISHEGARYKNVSNYGILISDGAFRVLIAGDGEIASNRLLEIIGDTPVDLAILNFSWITLNRGRNFVNKYLKPKHVLIYHIPTDDPFGYLSATQRFLQQLECEDARILSKPLQQEVFYMKNS